jgi:Ribosomal protein S18
MGRHRTGLCSRCQRKVAKCIKRARQMGTIPYIGTYAVKVYEYTYKHIPSLYYESSMLTQKLYFSVLQSITATARTTLCHYFQAAVYIIYHV